MSAGDAGLGVDLQVLFDAVGGPLPGLTEPAAAAVAAGLLVAAAGYEDRLLCWEAQERIRYVEAVIKQELAARAAAQREARKRAREEGAPDPAVAWHPQHRMPPPPAYGVPTGMAYGGYAGGHAPLFAHAVAPTVAVAAAAAAPPPVAAPAGGTGGGRGDAVPDVDLAPGGGPDSGLIIYNKMGRYFRNVLQKRVPAEKDMAKILQYVHKHNEHFWWVRQAWEGALEAAAVVQKVQLWQLYSRIIEAPDCASPIVRAVWHYKLPELVSAHMPFGIEDDRDFFTGLLIHWHGYGLVAAPVLRCVYESAVRACRDVGHELRIPALEALEAAAAGEGAAGKPAESAGSKDAER
eukprot:TRINITY_DN11566_c1_g1_i1.p1 TRINITY_DN11566_c1_g1~~TRINITY_DN11566_c1_g1_i1.p1  ORF type:complete len:350 (+),score=121.14 TRINITY_DN11566_c1_g1_i1:118-1167(+)